MKSIKAFLAALVLFGVTVVCMHVYVNTHLPSYNLRYGTWVEQAKFNSNEGLRKLMQEKDSLLILGSSELKHGQKSGFHADTIFQDADMKPVFVGQAGYQSLIAAITAGSMPEELSGKKVVLLVSPQWYKKKGVTASAFGNSFSESNFISFLKNPYISDKTKQYVIKRVKKLTKNQELMHQRIIQDVDWYMGEKLTADQILRKDLHTGLIREKSKTRLLAKMTLAGIPGQEETGKELSIDPLEWGKLWAKAEKKGEKYAGHNPYGMYDVAYKKKYQSLAEEGQIRKPDYKADSAEAKDLACFLKICKQQKIQPLVVMLPFNGCWYDETGYDSTKRQAIYDKTKAVAEKYGASYLDLSDEEYAPYSFEDGSHPGLKGLVNINEKIYEFYHESEK